MDKAVVDDDDVNAVILLAVAKPCSELGGGVARWEEDTVFDARNPNVGLEHKAMSKS